MRTLALVSAAALVLSGFPPAPESPLLAQASARELALDDPDQVCAPFLGGQYEVDDYSAGVMPVTGTRASPPPPMPSAPPPPIALQSSTSRMAQPGFAYRPQADRERYAGEEVAPIQAVADAPVSTFGIDVDTGSYANVRRFLNQEVL